MANEVIERRRERQRRSLEAQSRQQGHPGLVAIHDVMLMLELRDERIAELADFQRGVIMENLKRGHRYP